MALQFSTSVRNAMLNAIPSTAGASATLELRSGAAPANCGAADTGTLLASITLPSTWMEAAASGQIVKAGTWQDPAADADGTLGHFRIKQSTTCHMQGSISVSGGGGDMTVDNTNVATGQTITVLTFTINAGNA